MSIAQTYNETDIEYGVVNIIGAAVDKLQANVGLLILISIFTMIISAVTTFIGALMVLGKFRK